MSSCRKRLQQNAKHPETFTPNYMSLTHTAYESMVRHLRLPYRGIETTSVVGPFFWSALDPDDDDPHLRMHSLLLSCPFLLGVLLVLVLCGVLVALLRSLVSLSHFSADHVLPDWLTWVPVTEILFRKSDVRKKGKTRGWELMLSHSFRTGITTGFAKGTESSDMLESIRHLKICAGQTMHPMLLPLIILSHDLSAKTDQKQREARDWLRKLEHAVSMRNEIVEDEGYVRDAIMDLDQINRDLVECHSQVLWKRPQAYQEIIESMEKTMERFWELAQDDDKYGGLRGEAHKLHRSMSSRLEFYRAKLKGIENYAHTTLERLTIQRAAVSETRLSSSILARILPLPLPDPTALHFRLVFPGDV